MKDPIADKIRKKRNAIAWYERNRALTIARAKAWREENGPPKVVRPVLTKEEMRAKEKAANAAYNASKRGDRKKRYEENRGLILKDRAAYYQKNKANIVARVASWRKANPAKKAEYGNARRARMAGIGGRYTDANVKTLMRIQGGRCVYCKDDMSKGFHVDHIMPLSLGGSNDRKNIQLTCPTCNMRKNRKHPIDFAQQMGMLL